MEPILKNSDISNMAGSAGILIKMSLPKFIDEKIMIEMMENFKTYAAVDCPDEYETAREVAQEISNRFVHDLLYAATHVVEYYKTVAESTEGLENE